MTTFCISFYESHLLWSRRRRMRLPKRYRKTFAFRKSLFCEEIILFIVTFGTCCIYKEPRFFGENGVFATPVFLTKVKAIALPILSSTQSIKCKSEEQLLTWRYGRPAMDGSESRQLTVALSASPAHQFSHGEQTRHASHRHNFGENLYILSAVESQSRFFPYRDFLIHGVYHR